MGCYLLDDCIERDQMGIECKCHGFAAAADEEPTPEEIKLYDCGRRYACCTRVYRCKLCKARILARLEAPEME